MDKKELIIYICNSGYAYDAMDVARNAGAGGGTILHGRSSLTAEHKTFFGVTIHPEKDLLFIVCLKEQKQAIMNAINTQYGVTSKAGGVIFSMDIEDSIGINFNNQIKTDK
ncbi:MAG: hypothetical protein M0Q00_01535 [Acholeplasmataceae bacterium]|nr:hypothetical protein [Acholeplasmataceae bacterium]